MPAAPTISPGYSFSTWPASPPVFESLTIPEMLQVPLAPRPRSDLVERAISVGTVGESQHLAQPLDGAHAPLASAAGTVVGATEVRLFGGGSAPAVMLRTTHPGVESSAWRASDDAAALASIARMEIAPADWIDRIRSAGVWAARRASPDLIGQLHQALLRPVDTVLCGVLDVDPSACLNAALAAQFPMELVAGVALLAAMIKAPRAVVALDAAIPPTWTSGFRRAGKSSVKFVSLVNVYPQSDPTLMLYTLLGRRLRPGRLPTDQGVILLDAAAAIAVGRVALFGATAIAAPVVLRDHMLQQSFFTFAAPGIALGEVLQQTRTSAQSTLLRAGDVLRDVRCDLQSVIAVGTENVLHASQAEPINNPDPCTRCAWCIDACPTRVQPAGVFEAAQRGDLALAEASGVEACLECGVCSYVCPSGLPLLPAIQMMRRAVRGQ